MSEECPLCGQVLPEKISERELHQRLEGMTKKDLDAALRVEKKKFEEELSTQLTAEREIARQRAERTVSRELTELREQLKQTRETASEQLAKLNANFETRLAKEKEQAARTAEQAAKKEFDAWKRDSVAKLKSEITEAVRLAAKREESRLEKVQSELDRERTRHELERTRLLAEVSTLSRKVEKMSGQERGEEGELDLLQILRAAFPGDRIDRVGKGVKGCDILHDVMEDSKSVGRIVYESKNVGNWQNAFLAQAKKYRTQYETPYIVIVSSVFPKKHKDFCVFADVPVVSPQMAIPLATILRTGIIDLARFKQAGASPDEKALKLYEYLVSDRFSTQFREIAETVTGMREEQRKERDWHERNWERRAEQQDRVESRHRQIHAQVETILRETLGRKPIPIAARANN